LAVVILVTPPSGVMQGRRSAPLVDAERPTAITTLSVVTSKRSSIRC
jgi:hypothetical protein